MSSSPRAPIEVIDSHTEGEPTRVVVAGWPAPQGATMAARRDFMSAHQDELRRAIILEPRGHAAIVGALLTEPVSPGAEAGVVFFNNVGYLNMCGHGLIGVAATLAAMGREARGEVRIDTPVGPVAASFLGEGAVAITNVPAYAHAQDVEVDVPPYGRFRGDIAWGGNWFFLTELPGAELEMQNVDELSRVSVAIMAALAQQAIGGADGRRIDHVELFAAPRRADADSRNFVLCPGGAYDRSPCGTGTSAKMAALYARGKLALGQRWRQESITGSLFTGWLSEQDGALVPHIEGRAFVTGRARFEFAPGDPFRDGL